MSLDNVLMHPALAGMRAMPRWIVYRLAQSAKRPGKLDKFPLHYATGKTTSITDPNSWTDIQTAAESVQAWGPGHGLGFCFSADCGYWFLDLDSCLQPDSTTWSPFALQMLQVLPGAAVEISSSGRGWHLFGRGTVPAHSSRNFDHHAELYTADRFVAMSGLNLQGDCDTDCTAGISWVAQTYFPHRVSAPAIALQDGPRPEWRGPERDDDLIRRMLASKSAAGVFGGRASFAELWSADERALSRAYPADASSQEPYDRSSADAALAAHLAWWTGCHTERMDRLMRESGLVRDKYDRPDYLPRTIANACSLQKEVLQDKPSAVDVLAQIRQMESGDEVAAKWLALTLPLSRADSEQVIDAVERWAFASRSVLKAMLADARKAEASRRQHEAMSSRVSGRMQIEHRPESCTEQAYEVEAAIVAAAAPGAYVSFAGVISHVTTKALPDTHLIDDPESVPPPVPQIEPLDRVATRQAVERVAMFFEQRVGGGGPKAIAVPPLIIDTLIGKKLHAAPTVNGLVSHPIVLRNGEILAAEGLHSSGLFLSGVSATDARPYSQGEAVAALARLRVAFLDGFEFADRLDEDAALAGLLTGVQRRVLDSAPGLAVLASTQSSGKTTLCRRIHVVLTGRDMPASTFPVGDEAEASKRLLSALLRSPAMLCFDNVPDGFTFASGALAAAMTSPSIEQRVLGISRDASAPTNVLFTLTGNNLTLGADEVTRWLVCRLAPKSARPEERRFSHPDVVQHGLAIRASVLRDMVGIVAGYLACGESTVTATRFPNWDRMVRQPLMWAGALDVAEVFRANAKDSEPLQAHSALLWALSTIFGDRWFKAAEAVHAPASVTSGARETLTTALESLGVRDALKAQSVANVLKALAGKVAAIDGRELKITRARDSHDKLDRYRVAPA